MLNKRSILILIGILGAAYVGAYFYAVSKMEEVVSEKLDIRHDRIIDTGFPFNITFKFDGHESVKKLSFNIFTKKWDLYLKKLPNSMEDLKYKSYNWKHFDHLIISGKIESYFKLAQTLQKGIGDIDYFNLTNNYNLALKGSVSDPDLLVDTDVSLSFPGKRNYADIDDLKSDFPRRFAGNLKYNIDTNKQGDMPSFVRKMLEASYPEKTEVSFEGMSYAPIDLGNITALSMAKNILNFNLKLHGNTDTKLINSNANITLKTNDNIFSAEVKASEQYKEDALKKLHNVISKDDVSELVLFAMYNMGMQPSDSIKSKVKHLTNLIWSRIDFKINDDPKYWDRFYNLKTNYLISMAFPLEGSNSDLEFLLHVPNDTGEFELKIKGLMKGGIKSDSLEGIVSIKDNNNILSELSAYLRLTKFAFDKSTDLEQFKKIADNFDKDLDLIISTYNSFSDDPNDEDLNYTYRINMVKPDTSIINDRGTSLLEFMFATMMIFTNSDLHMEDLNKPIVESEKLYDPLDPNFEGEDL